MKKQLKITIPTTAEEIEISIIPVGKNGYRFESPVPVFGLDSSVLKEALDAAEKFRKEEMQNEPDTEKPAGEIVNFNVEHE